MTDATHTDCRRFEARISELIGGDPPTEGFVELCVHVRDCDDCGGILEAHSRLRDLSSPRAAAHDESGAHEEPSTGEWTRMREAVLAQLDAEASTTSSTGPAPPRLGVPESQRGRSFGTGPGFGRPVQWLAAAAVAMALLGSGWWLGRSTDAPGAPLGSAHTFTADDGLEGYEIDNVRVRDVDGDLVSVSFDMATHVETLRPRTDPLVREAVVRSLWGGADLGGRIAAIEQTGQLPLSETVRDALLYAMLEDPDVAVRMSAQQRLATTELDERVEAALLRVLRAEQSVQMRLLAVDMLAERRVDPGELVRAVEEGQPEPGNALKLLAANYARRF